METKTPKWSWIVLAVAVILAGLTSIFAPAYRKTVKDLQEAKTTIQSQTQEITGLVHQVQSLRESLTRSEVSGSIREPVLVGGQVAYRLVRWKSKNESMVKEQVLSALQENRSSLSSAVTMNETRHEHHEETTKRQTVAFGPGWSTEGRPWAILDGKLFGPVEGSFSAEFDPGKNVKFFRQAVGFLKVNVF